MPEHEPPVFILFGPTASGKTEILAELFSAGKTPLRAEIISADSMQVYRGMDIGTAKVPAELCIALPHHLINICEPDQQFNAGDFVRLANQAVKNIAAQGKLPVISGGTGFYLNNFIYGLPAAPPSDQKIRMELKQELAEKGSGALRAELALRDPVSAERIHANDDYRLLRALEVCRIAGKPLSSYQSSLTNSARQNTLIIALERTREDLYQRINQRCKKMLEQNLYKEITALFHKGYTPENPGLKAIGYQEFFQKDEAGNYRLIDITNNLDAIQEQIARNTRHYAKRQITYFKQIPAVKWISIKENDPLQKTTMQIYDELKTFMAAQNGL